MKNFIFLLLLALGMLSCKRTRPEGGTEPTYTVNGPCLMAVAYHQGGATDTCYLWNDIVSRYADTLNISDFRSPSMFRVSSYGEMVHVGQRFYYNGGSGVVHIYHAGDIERQICPDTTQITDNLGRNWCLVKRER